MDGDTQASAGTSVGEVLSAIGPRLREIRQQRQQSLDSVAAEAGLSVSTLSRLEVGKRQPTLDLLIPLARVYRIALDQLIAAPATGDPRVHLKPRRHKRGSIVVPLTEHPGRVQIFKQILAPQNPRLVTHEGYEWLYVLSGTLRLILGSSDTTISAGQVAEFDTRQPHWFGPADADAVVILHMFGPAGGHSVARVKPHL